MPDIYDIDFSLQADNLNVPSKRKPKITGFLTALMYPLQWLRDLFFGNYTVGASYPIWNNFTGYNIYDRVIFPGDKAVYECLTFTVVVPPTGDVLSTAFWFKVQDNFIGTNLRSKFNSQIIKLEYELNTWFLIPTTDPQIYIVNNVNNSIAFLLGLTGPTSSVMSKSSVFAQSYLGTTYSTISYDFTVMFPVAVYTALGPDATTRENTVRNFVDKYKLSGIHYNIITF